uniref:Uncharacterized protein n=1 Tax=Anopheles maculatus TaxID=74869 RepID=A0A182SWP1_9DIPT
MDDNVSGIHFNTYEKPIYRGGSSATSLASVAGTMSRVNTVTSALKRFFSKDESSRPNSATPDAAGTVPFKFPGSASSTNLAGGRIPDRAMGSMRITDQVIEEVDEQLTITSMQGNNDSRPTAASLFEHGPPKPSEPVDVPQQSYNRTQSSVAHGFNAQLTPPGADTMLSASAPETGRFEHNYVPLSPTDPDAVPMVASSTALRSMVDETDRVTTTFDSEETEKEQLERKTRLLARSISKQAVLGLIDTEMLLDELTKSTSDLGGSENKKPPQNTPDGPTSDTNSNVDTTL